MIYKYTNTVAQATDGAIQTTIHPGPSPQGRWHSNDLGVKKINLWW